MRLKRIGPKIQDELWFSYENKRLVRIDECTKRLDFIYLEPIEGDSTFTGFHLFEYAGDLIATEKVYNAKDGKKEIFIRQIDYEYDEYGNIINYTTTDIDTKSEEIVELTYHRSNHPYSRVNMYFTGETCINNVLTKTDLSEGLEYTYEIILDNNQYPKQILEKTNGMVSRIIMYTYFCRQVLSG